MKNLQNHNTTKQDDELIDNFVEFQFDHGTDEILCMLHGVQKAVGNNDECEICLNDYKQLMIFVINY